MIYVDHTVCNGLYCYVKCVHIDVIKPTTERVFESHFEGVSISNRDLCASLRK